MGKKKNFRFFSAWGARWTVEQDMTDARMRCLTAPENEMVYLKAGHLVKVSFGNDRVRNEPWMIRCFRHANVFEVAE